MFRKESTMARRSDHSREEIKAMALDAALTILEKEGARGLTARKVASAIGYTVGTLYLVFRNQQEMVLQLNARTLDDLNEWLEARSGPGDTPAGCLQKMAEAYIDYAVEKSARWNLLFDTVVEEGNELPDWYLMRLGRLFGRVERMLSPLSMQHEALEIERAARVLWASVHGICTLKIRHRLDLAGNQTTEEMAQMLIDNFLRGFAQV
jgi:AcrR family transcriptional regulator